MIVGITGNYCSGKDSASRLFAEQGFAIVDVDKIGYLALEQKREELLRHFGEGVLSGGGIDRKKLGAIVFADGERKRELEHIVHPWMIGRVKSMVRGRGDMVINAALLVEMCLFVLCDYVLGIDVSEETAIERGVARDSLSRGEARARLRSQIPLKEKLHYVDKIIENNGSFDEFAEEVTGLIRSIRG